MLAPALLLALADDSLEEREKIFYWRRAYLMRYLRGFTPESLGREPLSSLDGYMRALATLLEAESPKSAELRAEQDLT